MLNRIILRDPAGGGWLLFEDPNTVFTACEPSEVPDLLARVEAAQAGTDLTAAGYLAYEAATGFDPSLATKPRDTRPVACFGLFRPATRLGDLVSEAPSKGDTGRWAPVTGKRSHREKIATIKQQIALGNTYQVNLTMRLEGHADEGGWLLFQRMASHAPYSALLDFDRFAIVSASPELFFRLDQRQIVCRPMKGTARRGMTTAEDRVVAAALEGSIKNRAENVMITDMVRNDLGRIADPGSVRVDALYVIEKYPTLWQMTSTVSATSDAGIGQILAALFPCASITGAPKKSSMDIIANLEDGPRGVYTGAIGWFGPGRQACFSVAIRTAVVDKPTGYAVYGTGGGIVWDSDPDEEYAECLLKTQVLNDESHVQDFDLVETLRWDSTNGYFLLDQHLARLHDSAEYFDFPFDSGAVENALADAVNGLDMPQARVRLLQRRDGNVTIKTTPFDVSTGTPVVRLAVEPVDPLDVFLYHKTTRRDVYERALRAAEDADDVLLWNTDGYITETTIANVIVRLGGRLVTPPISCGLLGGTYRRWLLEHSDLEERPIHIEELTNFDEITLINSVRKSYTARLETAASEAAPARLGNLP